MSPTALSVTPPTQEDESRSSGQGSPGHNIYQNEPIEFLDSTGFPVERTSDQQPAHHDALILTKVRPDTAEAAYDGSWTLPRDLLAGHYRPVLYFFFEGVPEESPPSRPLLDVDRASDAAATESIYLPIVRLGNPAPPQFFWTLLTDTLSNGTRGTPAIEDRNRFAIASRILTQSETFVVPRLDPALGTPLTYRLEPFAPTVSRGDRADAPNPPLVPFRFPSGELTVRVVEPDGSAKILGPAPFVQARMKSLVDRRNLLLDFGGGHLTDVYQLSTMDNRFDIQFEQDGHHLITLDGHIEDVWGNTWSGGGTYEVHVARQLSLDTSVLPMTPFEVGDVFTPGLVVTPPVPAVVDVDFRLLSKSDPGQTVEERVSGQANRFGYFHPVGSGISLDQPGEYRVDVTASFRDQQGHLWMGSRTWGGVVAPREPTIIAHGRRGIDDLPAIGPQWFFRTQTGSVIGPNHVPFPFHSGDVTWQQKSDAAIPLLTFQDPSGRISSLLKDRTDDLDERAAVGELPLFSSRPDGFDSHLDPSKVDLWGYGYRFSSAATGPST